MMKKFFLKILLWTVCLFTLLLSYGSFCDWFFSSSGYLDRVNSKRSWVLGTEGRSFDAAVLGSSRAFRSFNMLELNKSTARNIINLAADGSGYADNYLTLYKFLQNGNSVKQLFLQVDIYSLNAKQSFSNAFHIHQFLPYWHDPRVKEVLQPYLSREEQVIWRAAPWVRYIKFNKYFSVKEIFRRYRLSKSKAIGPFDKTFGGPIDAAEGHADKPIDVKTRTRTFDDQDIFYLGKIVDLCRANGITIVSYKAPEYIGQKHATLNYEDLNKEIHRLLGQFNVEYLQPSANFESDQQNFADGTHLNTSGANSFTMQFAAILNQRGW